MTRDHKNRTGKASEQPAENPEDEVEGQILRWRAMEQPADNPDDEVEGHRARFFDAEQAAQQSQDNGDEMEGHAMRSRATEQPADSTEDEVEGHGYRRGVLEQPHEDEGEVEGHLVAPLNPELARNRMNDQLADAEQARLTKGLGKTRDGGMLDKIRRRLDNS